MMDIRVLPTLTDNYVFIIVDQTTKTCCVVDPGVSEPVIAYVDQLGYTITSIILTHHHDDHVGGVKQIVDKYQCRVYGNRPDAERLPCVTNFVEAGKTVRIGGYMFRILNAPGHTLGHILYHCEDEKICFVGDTLFSLGCGRLFEGTPKQMWTTLSQFHDMDPDTRIFCAHEYTEANLAFTQSLYENEALKTYGESIQRTRQLHQPTIPFRLGDELSLNPFISVTDADFRRDLGLSDLSALEAFAHVRRLKDNF